MITFILILTGFLYSILVSVLAYRQTGQKWMLFLPHWIDAKSGVSKSVRMHGTIAFTLLFIGMAMFLLSFNRMQGMF